MLLIVKTVKTLLYLLHEIKRKSFSRIGAKLWNEIPTKLRALPTATFKKKIKMILLNILENEDSYKDLESIISKVNFYSS